MTTQMKFSNITTPSGSIRANGEITNSQGKANKQLQAPHEWKQHFARNSKVIVSRTSSQRYSLSF